MKDGQFTGSSDKNIRNGHNVQLLFRMVIHEDHLHFHYVVQKTVAAELMVSKWLRSKTKNNNSAVILIETERCFNVCVKIYQVK